MVPVWTPFSHGWNSISKRQRINAARSSMPMLLTRDRRIITIMSITPWDIRIHIRQTCTHSFSMFNLRSREGNEFRAGDTPQGLPFLSPNAVCCLGDLACTLIGDMYDAV